MLELNQSRVEVVDGIKDCGNLCDCLAGQHLELKATAVVDVQVTVAKAAVEANTDWLESKLRQLRGGEY